MDLSLKEPVIKEQIEWLGVEPSLFRIYRKDYAQDAIRPEHVAARCIPRLQNQFIAIGVDDTIESVSIGYADNKPVLSPDREGSLKCVSPIKARFLIYLESRYQAVKSPVPSYA